MSETRISNGMRIKFVNQGEGILVSHKIYSNGAKMCRVHIDENKMEFKFIDPATGYIYQQGGGVTNREVLLRKAKRELKKFLNIYFEKESRSTAEDGN